MAAAKNKTAKKADTPAAENVEGGKEDKESKSPADTAAQEEDAKANEAPAPKKPTKRSKKKGRRNVKRAGKSKKSS